MSATEPKAHIEAQLEAYPVALDPSQVAEVLGVSRRYVDKLIDEGKIEAFTLDKSKIYKQKRVLKANLIAYILKQSNNN